MSLLKPHAQEYVRRSERADGAYGLYNDMGSRPRKRDYSYLVVSLVLIVLTTIVALIFI